MNLLKKNLLIIAFIFVGQALFAQVAERNIRTQEYRKLQERLCSGWNTMYNNSVITHMLLPENFAINLCFSADDNRPYKYQKDFIKNSGDIVLGLRSDDGSYTSSTVKYLGVDISIESATDGDDKLILITPTNPSKHYLIVEAGLLYNSEGAIGMKNNKLIAEFPTKEITVSSTAESVVNGYIASTSPHLTITLDNEIGIYTGKPRKLNEIKELIAKSREIQQKRIDSYGDLSESFLPMQTILTWNTIYDAPNRRVITPVSRDWNRYWGGYVLFDWDTYFAAYMLALFNKDLAMANAVEITKAITPSGFIPNYVSVSGFYDGAPSSSWDRSQPPVGSAIVYSIYKKYPEKWFLTEVYDELLTWNRWWNKERVIKDYLAWGSYGLRKDGTEDRGGIQGAMWESGLDNSPMYDNVPFNETTHTLELADVGLMSMYIMDCNSLMEIAKILGKKVDAEELKKRAAFYKKQLETLWDDKTGMFLNKRTDTGEFSHRMSPTNFYPMLANACSPKQAERMIKEHYYNTDEFYGEYVMPSIARNDPAFPDNAYWRGRIWAPMNFLVYLGMQNYDNIKEARLDFVQKSKKLLMKGWNENGSIWENYNAVTGDGRDDSTSTSFHHASDPFYHWGALLTFMEFIEKGYMQSEK